MAQAPTRSIASPPVSTATAHPYAGHVLEASQRFGVPAAWIWSVMRVESAGNPSATSHAGAMGLMQVMPRTYAGLRSRYRLGPNPYDPRDSILAGTAYLRELHDRHGSAGFLAAYNAGPGRWEAYVSRGRPLPKETVAYIARLRPMVGGSAAPLPTVAAQPDRLTWRRASLFVTLKEHAPNGGSGAASSQSEGAVLAAPGDTLAAPIVAPSTASTKAADALFAVKRPK